MTDPVEFLTPEPPPPDPQVPDTDRSYAMWLHLSAFLGYLVAPLAIIMPVVLWSSRRSESAFVDDHGREAINYNITLMIYSLAAGLLVFVGIGCVLLPAIVVIDIIVKTLAAVRAGSGEYWRYPATFRFLRPDAGSARCRRCGYDLRGAAHGACPECGQPV